MAYWMISSYRASSTDNIHRHDFSSLFLHEASGDSEMTVADSDLNAESENLEGDDAESCSWDYSSLIVGGENLDDIEWVGDAGTDDYCESVEGSGDYRDWVLDRMGGGSNGSDSSSSVCLIEGVVDQDLKERNDRTVVIDRMDNGEEDDDDKKRLFWETCLEVGYP